MEPEDILSVSLARLYDYEPIIHSSAGSFFTYTANPPFSPPLEITLRTPDTQSRNWSLQASSIWASSVYLADHIDRLHLDEYCNRRSPGKVSVLELGAGAGLPGILISKCYDNVLVTSSDYPDELLIQTLSENVERNLAHRCRVAPYAWGSDVSVLGMHTTGFDIVLAADTLWNSELHAMFIQTLRMTLKRTADARIHLIAGLHTGRYTLQAFLNAIDGSGFEIEDVTEREVNGQEERKWSIERAEKEHEKERRRWVVWISLKWEGLND